MIGTRTTPQDLVRMIKPDATDEECDYVLWEQSCFPFGPVNMWLPQVRKALTQPS